MTLEQLGTAFICLLVVFILWAFFVSFTGKSKIHALTKKYLVPIMCISFICLVGIYMLVAELAPMIK